MDGDRSHCGDGERIDFKVYFGGGGESSVQIPNPTEGGNGAIGTDEPNPEDQSADQEWESN